MLEIYFPTFVKLQRPLCIHIFFSQVHWFRCDVTSESDWVRLWESTEEALGKVDILVNNAGILYQRGWRKCVEVCLVREKTFL